MEARNHLLDVARGMLILLVVWGHLLESRGFNEGLYFSIYTFHMPAFAMISGVVAKPQLDTRELLKLGQRILSPLLVFQCLYYLALAQFAPSRVFSITTPAWIIWFLFSLLTWRLLLPLVAKLPHAFLLSVIAALFAGTLDWVGLEFGLSRTFVFFPAFLFGHLYGKRCIQLATRHRLSFSALFVAFLCAAFWVSDQMDIRWLWGSSPYSALSFDMSGVAYRAGAIAVGIIMSVALFALVPGRSQSLALLGRRTMPIYLLHGFPVMIFWSIGFQELNSFVFLLLTASLAIAIAYSLAKIGVGLFRVSKSQA